MNNSKSTGIVRRIDDLGRVVVPKEIRRTMRLREGDPLEIFATKDSITFKKYSVLGELSSCNDILRGLFRLFGYSVLLCDRNQVVDACGIPKNQYENRVFTEKFSSLNPCSLTVIDAANPTLVLKGSELYADIVIPIRAHGDLYGCVVMLKPLNGKQRNMQREPLFTGMELAAQIIISMIETD